MIEAARTTETLVNFYQTARRNNPEDSNLHKYLFYCLYCIVFCFGFRISFLVAFPFVVTDWIEHLDCMNWPA
jgi:hypothetical protein